MHCPGALTILLLLCHRVVCSEGSLLREKTLSHGETILEQFFAESKLGLNEIDPRHVTILGASDDQLRRTKPLLEAFPYFVGTDAKGFCDSREFSAQTFIIYFLTSLEEVEVKKVVENLSNCEGNRLYFIFEETAVNEDNIELLLRLAFEKIKLPIFIHNNGSSLKFYGYKMTASCMPKVKMLIEWVPGTSIKKFADRAGLIDGEGCPIPVSATHQPPWMELAEDAGGVVRIIGGSEGEVISTIVQKLNFTLVVQPLGISVEDEANHENWLVSSFLAGRAAFGIAKVRPTESVVEALGISHIYAQEYVIWCVPRIPRWKSSIMTSEFSWSTWILIGVTFLASFAVEKVVRNTPYLNRGHSNKSGCFSIILDLFGSTLGNPIVYRPLSIGGKAMLIIYICYSMVMTTAYRTSLSSILTTENSESSIVDVEGIIKANLTTGGDAYRLAILKDQSEEDDLTPELIKRYVIETNISKALLRVSNEKNFAFLTSFGDLGYYTKLLLKAGEPVSFVVLGKHVLVYSTVIIFPKSSQWAEKIDKMIDRMATAGLLDYWARNNLRRQRAKTFISESRQIMNTQEKLHRFTRDKFYIIFSIYCVALMFCVLIFFAELLVHKYKLTGGVQRSKNFKRFGARQCIPPL